MDVLSQLCVPPHSTIGHTAARAFSTPAGDVPSFPRDTLTLRHYMYNLYVEYAVVYTRYEAALRRYEAA